MSVGDALTFVGSTVLPAPHDQFYLWNVLIAHIIKKLIFVRHFSIDNNCFFSLVHMIFFVKNFHTQSLIAKCNSSAHLYLLYYWHATYTMRHKLSSPSHLPFGIVIQTHWLRALSKLASSSAISCNNDTVSPLIGQSWHVYPGILETTSTTVRYCVRLWIFSHTQNI